MILNKQRAYVMATGQANRTYWFLFDGLPATRHEEKIQGYSKDDENSLVEACAGDKISPMTTFGEMYATHSVSVLVPLEEYVFPKWHFGQIITIGDSAYKVRYTHPLMDHGKLGC